MPDRDKPLLASGDVAIAVALLTRLPLKPPRSPDRGSAAAWAYPLVGLIPGIFAALTALTATGLGLPPGLTAGLALAVLMVTTGALHEDGLADSADGLWGGWTPERRLQIMKDSRIGTYGVIALILSLGLRWAALTSIATAGGIATGLIAMAVLSRAPMVAVMHILPNARGTGLSSSVGRPAGSTTLVALAIAAVFGLIFIGFSTISLALILCATTFTIAAIAKAKIGGQTGDILGATQQISEIVILAFIAI